MIRTLLMIVAGGVVGTLLRYATGLWAAATWPRHAWLGTLAVNLAGCFAIGCLHGLFMARPDWPPEWRSALVVGLLGALTTFSSFSLDTLRLLEAGQWLVAAGYLAASLFGGLGAAWLGLQLVRL